MPQGVSCNLCGGHDTEPLFTLRDYRLWVDDVEWDAVCCRNCGLGYLNPQPTTADLERYYPSAYFDDRGTHVRRHRRLADFVRGEGGSLLDVGTARGDFLTVMRDRGWRVAGIEPAAEAGNPHSLEIHRDRFPEQCDLASEAYDVVTAWAVFEHLHDPGRAFEVCHRLLRSGGTLLVQVPNLRSISARWGMKEDIPRHLYFFSEKTLRAYGERTGLVLERVVQTPDLFGGSGKGALRLALVRALGKSTADFFEIYRTPRRERFSRWPFLSLAWLAAALVEQVVLNDWLVGKAGVSGGIVAEFHKPASPAVGSAAAEAAVERQ